ncbi:MAG: sodium:proton antiporter [Victivallaceae bacterium]|nr:sodium:proton antiporter [Victivallaceae bacterium]
MALGLPGMISVAAVLLFVAVLAAVGFKRLKIPYTVGLVLVGIGFYYLCGQVPELRQFRHFRLNRDLIMYALLPSLIFSASINIDSKLLFRNFTPTFLLAGPGLVISTFVISFIMYCFTPLTPAGSLLFGALISATDPVAVISLFEIVGAPKRLRILIDGESLFNDATAIVMYSLVYKILLTGTAFSLSTAGIAAYDFLFIFFGGLLVGAAAGYLMVQLVLPAGDDPMVEIALSVIVAYAAFIFADRVLGVSGVMACLGAGVVVSYYGISRFTPQTKNHLRQFWDFMSFVANSYIFLLLGFTEDFYLFRRQAFDFPVLNSIIWGIIAIQVSRAIIVFGICPLLGRRDKDQKIDWKYQVLIFWGGLRGAVPLALVFSLPENLPHRSLIVQITLGVVVFTLLAQGMTIGKLLSRFKLDRASSYRRFSQVHAVLVACRRSLEKLRKLVAVWHFPPPVVGELETGYRDKIRDRQAELNKLVKTEAGEKPALRRSIWTQVLRAERDSFRELFDSGFIPERLFRDLYFCLDQQLETIISSAGPPLSLASELFRKHPLVELIGKFSCRFGGRKYRAYRLNEAYLNCCALAVGVLSAREKLAELRKNDFFKDYPEDIEKCAKFHEENLREVMRRLKDLETAHPDLLPAISSTILQQMAYSNELKTIDELLEDMEISERIHTELTALLRRRISENRRRVYREILRGGAA